MQSSRFDRLTRTLGASLSRRQALVGSAGATALALTQAGASRAQGTPPVATPEPGSPVSYLYVQTYGGGTISPVDENGDAVLTLSTAPANTIAFADHPARTVYALPTDELPAELAFTAENPPNAALVTQDEEGATIVLVIELFDPVYDPGAHQVTYRIRELKEFSLFDESLTYYAVPMGEMPASFGAAALFIDNGGCFGGPYEPCNVDADCCGNAVCVPSQIIPDSGYDTSIRSARQYLCIPRS